MSARGHAWAWILGAACVLALLAGALERAPEASAEGPAAALRAQLARERDRHQAQTDALRGVLVRTRDRSARLAAVVRRDATLVPSPTLAVVAACESGGDPGAVSQGGRYRGLYQFDRRTWASVGGRGDPATARAAEQHHRADLLYVRRGLQPWPVCGRLA